MKSTFNRSAMIAAATAMAISGSVSTASAEAQRRAGPGTGLGGAFWSSLEDSIHSQFWMMRVQGLANNAANFEQRHTEFFHTVTYPAAGTQSIRLFDNVAPSEGVCNLNQGRIPSDQPMWLKYIGLSISDITAAGTVSTVRAVALNNAAPGTATAALLDVLGNGTFRLKVQNQIILEVRGLQRLLMGGPKISGIGTLTAPAVTQYISGPEAQPHGLELPGAYALVPDKPVSAEVTFPSVLALPATCTPGFTFHLIGESCIRRTK